MRKLIVLMAALVILPVVVFAQVSVGPALYFKSPVLLGDAIDVDLSNVNQFSAGGLLRFQAGIFQADGLALVSLGEVNSLNIFLDAGVAFDFELFLISFGAGPNFSNNFGATPLLQAGFNAKAGADLRLGPVMVGMSYIMTMNLDSSIKINTRSGLLGAHLLFSL